MSEECRHGKDPHECLTCSCLMERGAMRADLATLRARVAALESVERAGNEAMLGLTARLAEVQKHRDEERDGRLAFFLAWRNVEDPCPKCGGAGTRGYGNTSTWRGGIGGQAITTDACDSCWGTGDARKKGADLRQYMARLAAAERVVEVAREIDKGNGAWFAPDALRTALAAYDAARA